VRINGTKGLPLISYLLIISPFVEVPFQGLLPLWLHVPFEALCVSNTCVLRPIIQINSYACFGEKSSRMEGWMEVWLWIFA
jgi:hypothetical protein